VVLLLAAVALAWQMLPSWVVPDRSDDARFRLAGGFIPPDAQGARGVFVYGIEDGTLAHIGRTTEVGADTVAMVLDPDAGLGARPATALWLPRDLRTLWAARQDEIAPALDAHLARIAVAIEQAVADLVADPAFQRQHLPKLQSIIEEALTAEEVVAAQRRAAAAVRERFIDDFLPVLREIAFDTFRQSINEGVRDLFGELGAALRGKRPEHLSLEALIARMAEDQRFALVTEIMILELARDPAIIAYGEAVAAASAEVIARETADLSVASIWDDPDLQPVAAQLSATVEDELRALLPLLIFTADRTAIDPVAAIVLRGMLSADQRYFIVVVPPGAPDERYAGLEQRAYAVLVHAPSEP
jgi:hypothetical protein